MRKEQLEKTHLIGNFAAADMVLLLELILKGKFYVIDEPLFLRRIHKDISTLKPSDRTQLKGAAEIAAWFDPKGKIRHFPQFKWAWQLTDHIRTNPPPDANKILLYINTYRWALLKLSRYIKFRIKGVYAQVYSTLKISF